MATGRGTGGGTLRMADRLGRLEQARSADPWMTSGDIDAAADRYAERLQPGDLVDTSSWRGIVAAAPAPWLQVIYADAEPEDFRL